MQTIQFILYIFFTTLLCFLLHKVAKNYLLDKQDKQFFDMLFLSAQAYLFNMLKNLKNLKSLIQNVVKEEITLLPQSDPNTTIASISYLCSKA